MSLKFNLDPLRILQVVNDDLTGLLRSNTDCVPVGAETYRGQGRPNLNLLHLLALNDVIEEDATIESRAAQEQIVDRAECNACADVVVGGEFEAHRVALRRCRIYRCTSIFMLGHDLL